MITQDEAVLRSLGYEGGSDSDTDGTVDVAGSEISTEANRIGGESSDGTIEDGDIVVTSGVQGRPMMTCDQCLIVLKESCFNWFELADTVLGKMLILFK